MQTNKIDVMVDIETLGTVAESVITQIAAVRFDLQTGGMLGMINQHILIRSCLNLGMRVTEETLRFWFDQPHEVAKRVLFNEQAVTLPVALARLSQFLDIACRASDKDPEKDLRIWCAPDFDMALIKHAYDLTGLPPVFRYSAARCIRTYCEDHGIDRHAPVYSNIPSYDPHDAYFDCLVQILQVSDAYKASIAEDCKHVDAEEQKEQTDAACKEGHIHNDK